MRDTLKNEREVRILYIFDDFSHQALAMNVDYSHDSVNVCRKLEKDIAEHGHRVELRTDNSLEFLFSIYTDFCKQNNIETRYNKPRKPMRNGFVERFNCSNQEDILDAYLFNSIENHVTLPWNSNRTTIGTSYINH